MRVVANRIQNKPTGLQLKRGGREINTGSPFSALTLGRQSCEQFTELPKVSRAETQRRRVRKKHRDVYSGSPRLCVSARDDCFFTPSGLAQPAARCSLRSRMGLHFEIVQGGVTRNADTELRVCGSPVVAASLPRHRAAYSRLDTKRHHRSETSQRYRPSKSCGFIKPVRTGLRAGCGPELEGWFD
jgi:hypothetical protein